MSRTTPLTDTQIKHARPRTKEYNLADGSGLYLRVRTSGSKVWLFNYLKPHIRKRANLSLGHYPAISLAKARKKRLELLELLADDIDPQEHREQQQTQTKEAYANNFRHVFEEWLILKKTKVTADYTDNIRGSIELHVMPKLADTPIHKIRARSVIEILKPVAAKGTMETVKRLCQRLNEVMIFAVNTGVIEHNPLAGIKSAFASPSKKNFPTLRPEQLPELMIALNKASIKRTTHCLIEWQLHTMVRPSEAAGARWSEVDFEGSVWRIPASRMKRDREHVVPLSQQALSLLELMHPISGKREHIFPSDRNPRSHTHPQTANMAIKRMGFHGKLVAHGLRALASTTLNEQEFNPDVIESALAHSDKNQVRAAYNRSEYLTQRRVMMSWWSSHIEQAAQGNLSLAKPSNPTARSEPSISSRVLMPEYGL